MNNDRIWLELYNIAHSKLDPREISPFVEAGGVAAAIMTDSNNIYTGVCIDTACSLGMCAERNAIANMITNGESRITRLVCVMGNGTVGSPCCACRELMMQLSPCSSEIEILTSLEPIRAVRLGELVPDWWGQQRMNKTQR